MGEEQKPTDELTTWQEIADYLNISIRTAQLWERERSLPVHRYQGSSRVWASKAAVDEWKRRALGLPDQTLPPEPPIEPPPPPKSPWWRSKTAAVIGAVILLALGAALSRVWFIIKPPELDAVEPHPIPSLNTEQPLRLTGRNFREGAKVVFYPVGNGSPVPAEVTSTGSKQMVILANLGWGPANWVAQVIALDGSVSNRLPVTVASPPTPPPEITGISPNPVVGANRDQPATFFGDGFMSGLIVHLRVQDRTYLLSGKQIISVTASQAQVFMRTSSEAAQWTAQIQNPTGAISKPFPFRVVAPPPPGPRR